VRIVILSEARLERLGPREAGVTATDDRQIDARIDPNVVAGLYHEHAPELRRFVAGVLRNADLADEVLQNTFVKATEAGHTAREKTLKGWLFRVAFHEALALRRRRGVENKAIQTLGYVVRPAEMAVETPAEMAGRRETIAKIRSALERLPADQREVVRRRIYEQEKFAAIARELDVPLGTVLTRMRSALAKLRQWLDGSA
jgi:RNA polymerase sigma-70 factor (ECF subfamily)